MKKVIVGIIANPASGKDIRRLVAQALVVGNREKSSIVRRMLVGLHAARVDEVWIMPDKFGIGVLAIEELQRTHPEVVKGVDILNMEFSGTGIDTIRAARFMRQMGAGCIMVLGGDGTSRLASRECGEVPLLPVSTGTNNVLPQFVEGTIAGLAAGIIARNFPDEVDGLVNQSKVMDIVVNGDTVDSALVDVAALGGSFLGSKAVWEMDCLRQVAVTRASPANIGLSAIVGMLQSVAADAPRGAILEVDRDAKQSITAAVAPGLMATIPYCAVEEMLPGELYPVVADRPMVIALDGEREIFLGADDVAGIRLRLDGPRLVDVEKVMQEASKKKFFVEQL